MKIIVIGAKGMLGTDLVKLLNSTKHDVVAWDIDEIDITKKDEMRKIINEKPDAVINCAAFTNVDLAESEREACYAVNVTGVTNLTDVCKELNCVLVHISTDYVFDGEKASYDEDDKKNPLNYYGKTKSEGEDIIKRGLSKYYILRTSWLFGKNGNNFVESIKRLAKERKELVVVDDQISRPTYAKDLAGAILGALEKKIPFGLYHITNSGKCTRFEFAQKIVEFLGLKTKIIPGKTIQFPSPARRPKSSVLNNNKQEELRDWKDALREYLKE
jgi:dTDP-4-dehydrorhamnose reductase